MSLTKAYLSRPDLCYLHKIANYYQSSVKHNNNYQNILDIKLTHQLKLTKYQYVFIRQFLVWFQQFSRYLNF